MSKIQISVKVRSLWSLLTIVLIYSDKDRPKISLSTTRMTLLQAHSIEGDSRAGFPNELFSQISRKNISLLDCLEEWP